MGLRDLFDEVDEDGSGAISIEELRAAFQDMRVHYKFEMLGITLRDEKTFFTTLISMSQGQELDRDTFVQGCLRMKGVASSLDVQSIHVQLQKLCSDIRKLQGRC